MWENGNKKSDSSKFRSLQYASKIPPKTGLIISNPHLKKLINSQQNLKSQLKANSLING